MERWIVWSITIILLLCVVGVIFSERIADWINKHILKGGGRFRW